MPKHINPFDLVEAELENIVTDIKRLINYYLPYKNLIIFIEFYSGETHYFFKMSTDLK